MTDANLKAADNMTIIRIKKKKFGNRKIEEEND